MCFIFFNKKDYFYYKYFLGGVLFRPPMELVGPSGKSISGSNKHILKLMIDQIFGHG
jgi:hypothetical protein